MRGDEFDDHFCPRINKTRLVTTCPATTASLFYSFLSFLPLTKISFQSLNLSQFFRMSLFFKNDLARSPRTFFLRDLLFDEKHIHEFITKNRSNA